jgi:phospholipase C
VSFLALAGSVQAQPARFQHIILAIQENRTPDNFFNMLCRDANGVVLPSVCAVPPGSGQYNILTSNWRTVDGGLIQPHPMALSQNFDIGHVFANFNTECDHVAGNASACRGDGFASETCIQGTCPALPAYGYVQDTLMQPYIDLVRSYGWGNYFFQTNRGSSGPAHQFLFGATSAATAAADAAGDFIADFGQPAGCTTSATAGVVGPNGTYVGSASTCLQHGAVSTLLEAAGVSWRYYGANVGGWPDSGNSGLWMSPSDIASICGASGGVCAGSDWQQHVVLTPSQVLSDISTNCTLAGVSWVIPEGEASDHIGYGGGSGGPDWIASIVNAVGQSACRNPDRSSYWDSTAIIVTWDDWGGFYDHELPTFEAYPQGGYQMGFRVPLIVVSAYTPKGYISNVNPEDFGSIARFIEHNFRTQSLGFADTRGTGDLSEFFPQTTPRKFSPIATVAKSAQDFTKAAADPNHKPTAPDDD